MDKHTPGPWIYAEFELYEGAGIRFNIAQADGAPFTPHYSDVANTIAGEVIEIQEANARLISAAPELLAALEIAELEAERLDSQFPSDSLAMIRAAIAKARGQQ